MRSLFAQLEAEPEPSTVCLGLGASGSHEQPRCFGCGLPVDVPGWHLDPQTGDYECQSPQAGTAATPAG